MSVNTTPFLHLPQWEANEQPSYLGEINPAFAAIDSGYGDIKTLAQTGVSNSREAVTVANAAKAQSQANAGAITTLQHDFAQLEEDFAASSQIQMIDLEFDNVLPQITKIRGDCRFNKYCADLSIDFTWSGETTSVNYIAKILNLPFIWKTVRLVNTPSVMYNPNETYVNINRWIDPASAVLMNDGNISLTAFKTYVNQVAFSISIWTCVPIFKSSISRSLIPDNCFILT